MIAFTRVGSWYTTFIVFCFSLCIQLNLANEAIATEFLATPPQPSTTQTALLPRYRASPLPSFTTPIPIKALPKIGPSPMI